MGPARRADDGPRAVPRCVRAQRGLPRPGREVEYACSILGRRKTGAEGRTNGGDRASGCPLGRLERDQTRSTSGIGGEWNEMGEVEGGSFRRRLTSPWSNVAGVTLTVSTACRSLRMAVARSVCPSMQQGGGAVAHPLLQQSCAAPAGAPGMKQSPRVPDPARAVATTRTRQRPWLRVSVILAITPPERARVKARPPHRSSPLPARLLGPRE